MNCSCYSVDEVILIISRRIYYEVYMLNKKYTTF